MRYFIISGEPSGDLHARNLIRGLESEDEHCSIFFWDSGRMVSVMGFTEVLSSLSRIRRIFSACKAEVAAFQPDVVILVDYPGFNLRMARFAHGMGIRTFYYIPPKLWARGEGRIRKIRRWVDEIFIIFPFEIEYFRKLGVNAVYCGNPLLDSLDADEKLKSGRASFLERNMLEDKPLIALLAGSRKAELKWLMPRFASLEKMLSSDSRFDGFSLVVAGAPKMSREDYEKYLPEGSSIRVIFGETYPLLANAEAAVISSGTASLEAALIGTPQVVCYGFNRLTYILARMFVRVKYISLANLIMDRSIFRELIQDESSVQNIRDELSRLLFDSQYRSSMKENYRQLRASLGGTGASSRIARKMIDLLKDDVQMADK